VTTETQQAKRPTSFDVARKAGVSRATVSHVMNGRGRIPEETRQRVLDAASELQYRPSPAGRALVRGRSDVLVIVIPHTTFGRNLQDLVDDITAQADMHGLSVVVRFAGPNREETLAAVQHFRPVAVVDFGILDAAHRDSLEASGAVVIPKLRPDDTLENNANFIIGELMGQELLRNGPRRLVFGALLDERSDPFGPARYEGLKHWARAHGLPAPGRVEIPLHRADATAALEAEYAGEPIGVACYNDAVALAVLAAGRDLGLSVPDQLSVMGVDATAEGQLSSPRLTTLKPDNGPVMARIAADLTSLDGRTVPPVEAAEHVQAFTVIPGETT
jgi:DNA-binding LacI/PurR family transcriptional regulator